MGKLIKVLKLPAVIILAGLCLLVIAASLPVGGWRGLSVQTGSMEPAVRPGDLVLVHKVAAETIQTGDIITFANPQNKRETITHRVKSVIRDGGPIRFITQGDANPMPDLPVYSHQLIGRADYAVPHAGKLFDWARHPAGLFAAIYVPALIIIYGELKRLVRYYRSQQPYIAAEFEKRFRGIGARSRTAMSTLKIGLLIVGAALVIAMPARAAIMVSATLSNNLISITNPPDETEQGSVLVCNFPSAVALLSYAPEDMFYPKLSTAPLALDAPLPAGTYRVIGTSTDNHLANPGEPDQPNERWFAQLYGADQTVPLTVTGVSEDLPSTSDAIATTLNETLEITEPITALRYVHNAFNTGAEQTAFGGRAYSQLTEAEKRQVLWNSIHPDCLEFIPVENPQTAATPPAAGVPAAAEASPAPLAMAPFTVCAFPAEAFLTAFNVDEAMWPGFDQAPMALYTPIPTGTYRVEAFTEIAAANLPPSAVPQTNQSWYAEFYSSESNSSFITKTGSSSDLPDGQTESTAIVNQTLTITKEATHIRYVHSAKDTGLETESLHRLPAEILHDVQERLARANALRPGCLELTPLL